MNEMSGAGLVHLCWFVQRAAQGWGCDTQLLQGSYQFRNNNAVHFRRDLNPF